MVDQNSLMFFTCLFMSLFYLNYCDSQTHNVNDVIELRKHEKREQMYHYKDGQQTKRNTLENAKNYILSLIRPKALIFTPEAGTDALLIHTPGCYIPNYGKQIVFGKTVYCKTECGRRAIFIKKIYDLGKPVLVFKIDKDTFRRYSKNKEYECCYSYAVRSNETLGQASRLSYTTCRMFRSGSKAELKHEIIFVQCYTQAIQPSILYEDVYRFVKKLRRSSVRSMEDNWNVLLIGMDTMSRARISIAMPKTVKYLQAQGWLDFRGYQKIDSNTYPNLISVLTGLKLKTVDKACSSGMHRCNNITVWNTFREAGYITAFGEDYIEKPDIFSRYNGFKQAPTHHYMRTLFLTGEELRENVLCTKHQSSAKHIYDYAYDFANTYAQEKFFGTFWITSFSHNTDNLPLLFEKDTIDFFHKIRRSEFLKNTFIMLISDHGTRFGDSRLQMSSYYEERMPMLFIWVPTKFRKMHYEKYYNLQVNQNRLVTPYDIYLTLVKISDVSTNSANIETKACPLCRTLFEEKSLYRTCVDAGISENWCICRAMTNLDNVTDAGVQNSVQTAVFHMQNYTLSIKTSDYTTCRPLRLNKVFRIHSYINQMNKKNYVIALQMVEDHLKEDQVPKNMSYEMTVLKDKTYRLTHVDTISSYNSTNGDCVKNQSDRGFCVCAFV